MSDTPLSKIGEMRERLESLERDLTDFAEALARQHDALQSLRANWSAKAKQDQALREVQACTTSAATMVQQMGQRMPQIRSLFKSVQAELAAEEKERGQLTALYEVSQVVNSTLDLSEVLNIVMDTIISLTEAERGFLMLLNEETGELDFKVARNMDRETLEGSSFEISRTIVNRVREEGEPILTTNAQADPRFSAQASVVSYSLRSILCVPLKVKDKITGVIYSDNRIKAGLFTERDRDLLAAFADQAAMAIENARLFENVVIAKNLMDNVFASIASGVITTDAMDKITLFNRAAASILSVPAEQSIGASYHDVLSTLEGGLRPLVEEVKVKEQEYIAYEFEPELPQRGAVSLSMNLSPLKDAQEETLGVAIVIDDLTEKKRFERERAMVKRYLPSELVDRLADLKELRLGGTRQLITTFFADIRGFTTYSEQHDPEQVVEVINSYFSMAAKIIRAKKGIVDKYLGDAVMAHFGTPLHPIADHALQAVRTAWAIKQAMDEYHKSVPPADRLSFGMGVNTGEAVVGNVGGEDQMEYTPIGDAVNLAKRLQERALPDQILLSRSTYEKVKDQVKVNALQPIQVKGRMAFEQVYELVGIKD
jgi:PAS domain S-box-containing protein